MRSTMMLSLVAVLVFVSWAAAVSGPTAIAPKTIKEVMKLAHKDGLLKKVQEGQASDDDKKQLLSLYLDMLEGKPKKGDEAGWRQAAGATALSAAKVMLGRDGALDELKQTSDCKSCHDKFK